MERERYDVVLRFVPEADRTGMSEARMRTAFSVEAREETARLIAALDRAIGGDHIDIQSVNIMELADLVIVNKADGDLAPAAARTRGDYASAVHLLRPKWNAWATEVLACSALNGIGVAEVWQAVTSFRASVTANGELVEARSAQATAWLWSEIGDTLIDRFRSDATVASLLPDIESSVAAGRITPAKAALQLLEAFGANG